MFESRDTITTIGSARTGKIATPSHEKWTDSHESRGIRLGEDDKIGKWNLTYKNVHGSGASEENVLSVQIDDATNLQQNGRYRDRIEISRRGKFAPTRASVTEREMPEKLPCDDK
jgi:hypothetical protein